MPSNLFMIVLVKSGKTWFFVQNDFISLFSSRMILPYLGILSHLCMINCTLSSDLTLGILSPESMINCTSHNHLLLFMIYYIPDGFLHSTPTSDPSCCSLVLWSYLRYPFSFILYTITIWFCVQVIFSHCFHALWSIYFGFSLSLISETLVCRRQSFILWVY